MQAKLEYRFLRSPFAGAISGVLDSGSGNSVTQYFGAANNQEVLATHDGVIVRVQKSVTFGNGIWLMGQTPIIIEGIEMYPRTSYWHLSNDVPMRNFGDIVGKGGVLGGADNTGYSTGTHLHFGLKFFLDKEGAKEAFPNNGYEGYIDPIHFFEERWYDGEIKGTYKLTEEFMFRLIQKQDAEDIWAVDKYGVRHLILSYQDRVKGEKMGMWSTDFEVVQELNYPEGNVIILHDSK